MPLTVGKWKPVKRKAPKPVAAPIKGISDTNPDGSFQVTRPDIAPAIPGTVNTGNPSGTPLPTIKESFDKWLATDPAFQRMLQDQRFGRSSSIGAAAEQIVRTLARLGDPNLLQNANLAALAGGLVDPETGQASSIMSDLLAAIQSQRANGLGGALDAGGNTILAQIGRELDRAKTVTNASAAGRGVYRSGRRQENIANVEDEASRAQFDARQAAIDAIMGIGRDVVTGERNRYLERGDALGDAQGRYDATHGDDTFFTPPDPNAEPTLVNNTSPAAGNKLSFFGSQFGTSRAEKNRFKNMFLAAQAKRKPGARITWAEFLKLRPQVAAHFGLGG